MSQPTFVASSIIHGQGLFAKDPINNGSVIGWIKSKPAANDGDYVLWIDDHQSLEVICDLRYINHSDQANACYYDDLSVIALRDIHAGEEITHNYAGTDG